MKNSFALFALDQSLADQCAWAVYVFFMESVVLYWYLVIANS